MQFKKLRHRTSLYAKKVTSSWKLHNQQNCPWSPFSHQGLINKEEFYEAITNGKFCNIKLASQNVASPKSVTLKHNTIAFESQLRCSKLISILMPDSILMCRFCGSSEGNEKRNSPVVILTISCCKIEQFSMSVNGSSHFLWFCFT